MDLLDVLFPAAEFALAERRNASACRCGALEPVRIDATGCSECSDHWPRCHWCGRWVGEPGEWLPGYRWVLDETGADARLCEPCWEGTK